MLSALKRIQREGGWVCAKSLQSCSILCDPVDHSLPGSSAHGILQTRILERVAMTFSRGSSQSGIEPAPLISPTFAGGWASLVAQLVKNLPAMLETWVRSLGWEEPLEKGKATHSSILAWRTPWTVCIVHGVAKSRTPLSGFHFHFPLSHLGSP